MAGMEEQKNAQLVWIKSNNGKFMKLELSLDDTVENIKQIIQDREGIAPDQQRLEHKGVLMTDGTTLKDYTTEAPIVLKYQDESPYTTIDLIMKLR